MEYKKKLEIIKIILEQFMINLQKIELNIIKEDNLILMIHLRLLLKILKKLRQIRLNI